MNHLSSFMVNSESKEKYLFKDRKHLKHVFLDPGWCRNDKSALKFMKSSDGTGIFKWVNKTALQFIV